MKKALVLILVSVFVLTAASAFALISNTRHNFTGGFGNTVSGITLCQLCHIPHGGSTATAGLPIWSRSTPTNTAFTVYNGSGAGVNGTTLSGTTVNMPGTFSLTCLSCHDGTIAINVISKNSVTTTYAITANNAYVNGTSGLLTTATNATTGYKPNLLQDLRNDHPIGVAYRGTSATLAGLVNSTTVNGVVQVVNGSYSYPMFQTDRVECASCHDPHNNPAGRLPMLRGLTTQICQDCHATK